MKSIFYRLLNTPVFGASILFWVALIFLLSGKIYQDNLDVEDRWKTSIPEYRNRTELTDLRQNLQNQLSEYQMEKEHSLDWSEDDEWNLQFLDEKMKIVSFLEKHYYQYSEIRDGNWMQAIERTRWVYSSTIYDCTWPYFLFIIILLVYMIVVVGKSKGAGVFDCLMYGRKRVFWEQYLSGMFCVAAFLMLQFVLILVLRFVFPKTTTFLLYYQNGEIHIVREITEYMGVSIFVFVRALVVYTLVFCLAQLINSLIGLLIGAVVIGFTVLKIKQYLQYEFVDALTSALIYGYSKSYELWYMGVIKLLFFAVLGFMVYGTYWWCCRRNLRMSYE